MSFQPKVSVVVPIYNVEKYLPECVDSLFAQTLEDIEIVLVDDGSPDGCPALCDSYAAKDARVKVVHKPNGGLISARIAGVNAATAPYVGFVDADDFAAPHMFETLYNAAAENEADLVCCSFYSYWSSGKTEPYVWSFPAGVFKGERLEKEFYPIWFANRKEHWDGMVHSVWSKLYKRSILADVYETMATNVTLGEDLMATYAVVAQAECIVTLPEERLLYYRQVDGSMQHNYWKDFYNNEVTLLNHLRTMKRRPQAEEAIREGLARHEAYCIYDILYNETKPNRRTTKAERKEIVRAFLEEEPWQTALHRDVIRSDNQTSLLFQRLLKARKPGLVQLVIWLATQKNRLSQVIHHG